MACIEIIKSINFSFQRDIIILPYRTTSLNEKKATNLREREEHIQVIEMEERKLGNNISLSQK